MGLCYHGSVAVRRAGFVLAVALAGGLADGRAAADDNAENIRAAARAFDEGRRLFLENKFEPAAVQFENAFVDAPRAEALRNAIRARKSAKQYARAATLAQLALDQYASDAPTVQLANEVLAEANGKAHAVIVACDPKCAVAADGRALSLVDSRTQRIFLDPGPHDLAVSFGPRTRPFKIDAKAGGKTELSVRPPEDASKRGLEPDRSSHGRPLGPVVFVVLAGLTAVGAGATVVSGLDAKNNPGPDAVRRDCAGLGESCPTYQRGLDAQLRTNILLGATAGLAVITAVVGVFFTEWSSPPASPKAGMWVSPLGVSGMF
jgi:hypothetical protein